MPGCTSTEPNRRAVLKQLPKRVIFTPKDALPFYQSKPKLFFSVFPWRRRLGHLAGSSHIRMMGVKGKEQAAGSNRAGEGPALPACHPAVTGYCGHCTGGQGPQLHSWETNHPRPRMVRTPTLQESLQPWGWGNTWSKVEAMGGHVWWWHMVLAWSLHGHMSLCVVNQGWARY